MVHNKFKFYRLKREWEVERLSTFFMDLHYGNISITVVYSVSENSLLLLKKGTNQVEAELIIPLLSDFTIDTYLNDLYPRLVRFLEVQYNPSAKFKPFDFFRFFDSKFLVRKHATESETQYINQSRHLEDPNAIYFLRLIPHDGKNNGNVTAANRNKTKWLLPKFYDRHKHDNISVAYTADKRKRRPIPKEYL